MKQVTIFTLVSSILAGGITDETGWHPEMSEWTHFTAIPQVDPTVKNDEICDVTDETCNSYGYSLDGKFAIEHPANGPWYFGLVVRLMLPKGVDLKENTTYSVWGQMLGGDFAEDYSCNIRFVPTKDETNPEVTVNRNIDPEKFNGGQVTLTQGCKAKKGQFYKYLLKSKFRATNSKYKTSSCSPWVYTRGHDDGLIKVYRDPGFKSYTRCTVVRDFNKLSKLGRSNISLKMGKPVPINLGFAVWSTSSGKPRPLAKGQAKTMEFTLLEPIYSWHERAKREDKYMSDAV